MVVYLLVSFLLAANDLCHMLNSQLSREEQDLGSDIPGGLLIYKLVNLLTLVKKELWLDVTLSSQCFLLILLIQHVFQSLVSYMNRLSIQIFHFCHIKVGEACKEMLINFKQFLLFIFVVARVLYDDIQWLWYYALGKMLTIIDQKEKSQVLWLHGNQNILQKIHTHSKEHILFVVSSFWILCLILLTSLSLILIWRRSAILNWIFLHNAL